MRSSVRKQISCCVMSEEKIDREPITIVLENANLEIVKAGKSYEVQRFYSPFLDFPDWYCAQLLNCDDHAHILKKHKRDPVSLSY